MKEKFERFKNEKIVVNVRSQKQYDDFMKLCEKQGLKWSTGTLATKLNIYNISKENTCIDLNNLEELSYCDIDFHKNYGYKIITYKDFMKKSRQFTKSDLKDNHIVVYESGYKELWCQNENRHIVNEDLTSKSKMISDIMEVWEFDKLVWKREEQILDEKEKRWLKNFIRSTNIEFVEIAKASSRTHMKEFLVLSYKIFDTSEIIQFPYFEANTMYKGMEVNKTYTLEELGLED